MRSDAAEDLAFIVTASANAFKIYKGVLILRSLSRVMSIGVTVSLHQEVSWVALPFKPETKVPTALRSIQISRPHCTVTSASPYMYSTRPRD